MLKLPAAANWFTSWGTDRRRSARCAVRPAVAGGGRRAVRNSRPLRVGFGVPSTRHGSGRLSADRAARVGSRGSSADDCEMIGNGLLPGTGAGADVTKRHSSAAVASLSWTVCLTCTRKEPVSTNARRKSRSRFSRLSHPRLSPAGNHRTCPWTNPAGAY